MSDGPEQSGPLAFSLSYISPNHQAFDEPRIYFEGRHPVVRLRGRVIFEADVATFLGVLRATTPLDPAQPVMVAGDP